MKDYRSLRLHEDLTTDDRVLKLFRDAYDRKDKKDRAVKTVIFWFAVIFVMTAIVGAKLWSMGAIVGLK